MLEGNVRISRGNRHDAALGRNGNGRPDGIASQRTTEPSLFRAKVWAKVKDSGTATSIPVVPFGRNGDDPARPRLAQPCWSSPRTGLNHRFFEAAVDTLAAIAMTPLCAQQARPSGRKCCRPGQNRAILLQNDGVSMGKVEISIANGVTSSRNGHHPVPHRPAIPVCLSCCCSPRQNRAIAPQGHGVIPSRRHGHNAALRVNRDFNG